MLEDMLRDFFCFNRSDGSIDVNSTLQISTIKRVSVKNNMKLAPRTTSNQVNPLSLERKCLHIYVDTNRQTFSCGRPARRNGAAADDSILKRPSNN